VICYRKLGLKYFVSGTQRQGQPSAELPGVTTGWNPAGRWMPHG
jgi:hypothetical protein